mgnify:CR=1 FL=1
MAARFDKKDKAESYSRQKTKANHSLYYLNGSWHAYDNSDEPNLYTVASLKAYTINDKSHVQTKKLKNQISMMSLKIILKF